MNTTTTRRIFTNGSKSLASNESGSQCMNISSGTQSFQELSTNSPATKDTTKKTSLINTSLSKTEGSCNRSNETTRTSLNSNEVPIIVSQEHLKLVQDKSIYWYKPSISVKMAAKLLRSQPTGTFIIRDSVSSPGSFGMALKVVAEASNMSPKRDRFVHHYLIQQTPDGFRLRGCSKEPVFNSLSALLYQHTVDEMALPCVLRLPSSDLYSNVSSNDLKNCDTC